MLDRDVVQTVQCGHKVRFQGMLRGKCSLAEPRTEWVTTYPCLLFVTDHQLLKWSSILAPTAQDCLWPLRLKQKHTSAKISSLLRPMKVVLKKDITGKVSDSLTHLETGVHLCEERALSTKSQHTTLGHGCDDVVVLNNTGLVQHFDRVRLLGRLVLGEEHLAKAALAEHLCDRLTTKNNGKQCSDSC